MIARNEQSFEGKDINHNGQLERSLLGHHLVLKNYQSSQQRLDNEKPSVRIFNNQESQKLQIMNMQKSDVSELSAVFDTINGAQSYRISNLNQLKGNVMMQNFVNNGITNNKNALKQNRVFEDMLDQQNKFLQSNFYEGISSVGSPSMKLFKQPPGFFPNENRQTMYDLLTNDNVNTFDN